MSTTTEKCGFIKPEKTDAANITATNGNWDKLESLLQASDATSSDGETYTITNADIPECYDGLQLVIKPRMDSVKSPIVVINGVTHYLKYYNRDKNAYNPVESNFFKSGRLVEVISVVSGSSYFLIPTFTDRLSIAQGGTGATDKVSALANLGAAPLGLCSKIYTAANDDADLIELNAILDTMGNGENGGKAVTYAICKREYSVDQTALHSWLYRIESTNKNFARVEATSSLGEGCKMQRIRLSGNWLPWEHINPPMLVDQEYRTAERWLGKPVYTKLVNYTAESDLGNTSGASGFSIVFGTQGFSELIRYCGNIEGTGRAIPCFYNPEDGGGYVGVNFMNHQGVSLALNKKVIPKGTKIILQVWYTKQ